MKIPSQQDYERDLKQQLLKLGYVENEHTWTPSDPYLICGWFNRKSVGFNQNHSQVKYNYAIDTYNPQLFLALAGMTNDPIKEGDWVMSLNTSVDYEADKIYSVDELRKGKMDSIIIRSSMSSPEPFAEKSIKYFRKATKDELIEHFDKIPNQSINMKKILSRTDFKRIYEIACTNWKTKLAEKFKDLLIQDTVEVDEEYYKIMRAACTPEQHKLFDEIFGKDIEDKYRMKAFSTPDNENLKAFCKEALEYEDAIEILHGVAKNKDDTGRGLWLRGEWEITKIPGGVIAIPVR